MSRRRAGCRGILAAVFLAACGEGVFTPKCAVPTAADHAHPAALAVLGADRLAVAHADQEESFCGGFVTVVDASGQVHGVHLVEVPDGWEGNFAAAATTASYLWLAGRRHGHLVALRRDSLRVAKVLAGLQADRVFRVNDDLIVAWSAPYGEQPHLMWLDGEGNIRGRLAVGGARLTGVAPDGERRQVWLSFDGAGALGLVDEDDLGTMRSISPYAPGEVLAARGMAVHGRALVVADYARGSIARIDLATRKAVAMESVGFRPELVVVDAADRLWVVDADGTAFVREALGWRTVATGANRPAAAVGFGAGVAIADFGGNRLLLVAP